MTIRTTESRISDSIRRLETDADVWIATSGPDGTPHLVPLSLAWDGERILVATPADTATARNAA
ncbi:MAG: pyridoxamine 5'-phosphate oxidase family protein, partial [Ilumatobacteraceae bacterium]